MVDVNSDSHNNPHSPRAPTCGIPQRVPGFSGLVGAIPPVPCDSQMPIRILRLPEVMARVGIRRSSIYDKMEEGLFPQPIHLGPRAVGWLEHEIDAWLAVRIKARLVTKK